MGKGVAMNSRSVSFVSVLACCLLVNVAVGGSTLGIANARISSGGGKSSSGQFAVTGTIAQPLADVGVSGGSFSVSAGFWSAQVKTPVVTPGDMNCDGDVDASDVVPFAIALVDSADYVITYQGCMRINADMNGDQQIDGADIQVFLDTLVGDL